VSTPVKDARQFRTVTAISAIVAGVLIVLVEVLSISAVSADVDLLSEPADLITLGADEAGILRWSWLLAVLGFYVLLIPVILYLGHRLDSRSPGLSRLVMVVGIGSVFVGTIELAMMVAALPPMMTAWSTATATEQTSLAMVFKVVTDITFFGLSPLAYVLGGIWWVGVGSLLRPERPAFAVVTIILGVGTLASGLGYLIQLDLLARLEFINYLLAPIWALWIGVVVARDRSKMVTSAA
jgi:hypothetical protein